MVKSFQSIVFLSISSVIVHCLLTCSGTVHLVNLIPLSFVLDFCMKCVQESGSESELEGNEAKERELRERALKSLKKAKKSRH